MQQLQLLSQNSNIEPDSKRQKIDNFSGLDVKEIKGGEVCDKLCVGYFPFLSCYFMREL